MQSIKALLPSLTIIWSMWEMTKGTDPMFMSVRLKVLLVTSSAVVKAANKMTRRVVGRKYKKWWLFSMFIFLQWYTQLAGNWDWFRSTQALEVRRSQESSTLICAI